MYDASTTQNPLLSNMIFGQFKKNDRLLKRVIEPNWPVRKLRAPILSSLLYERVAANSFLDLRDSADTTPLLPHPIRLGADLI